MSQNRVKKFKSSIQRLKTKVTNKCRKFQEDKEAWASFQRGYKMSVLYLFIVRPVQAIDTLDELLERARNLQNITDTTPAEAVGKLGALRNWFQKLNLPAIRECIPTLGMGKLVGCSPYYLVGFLVAVFGYKYFKYLRYQRDLEDFSVFYF